MYSINDISKETGLKKLFIRKCLNTFEDILTPYTQRGNYNSILVDSNGLVIFKRIKDLKEQELSVSEIKNRLEKDLETGKTGVSKVVKTDDKSAETINYIDEILKLHQLLNEEKDKLNQEVKDERERRFNEVSQKEQTLRDLTRENAILAGTLKLLPEGKTPEVIKQEYEQQQNRDREIIKIISDLENTGVFSFKRRKKLVRRLRELL